MRTALPAAAVAAVILGVAALLVPDLPPLDELGGDAPHYEAMAEHPLEPVAEAPWGKRIGVPLVVAALPFSTYTGFLLVAVVSILAAAVLVALVARELDLPLGAQVAAAALAAGAYVGVHALYNPYYVDPSALAVVALGLLLALRRQLVALAALLPFGLLVKEVVATLIVLLYVFDPQRRQALDGRAAARALAYSVPTFVSFALVQLLVPVAAPAEEDVRLKAFLETSIFARGFLESAANPLVALFGLGLLLWPLGLVVGPPDLRSLHVWAVAAVPVLVFGHWERTLSVFLPLAAAAVLFALRPLPRRAAASFVAGSLWITAIVGALTIGGGRAGVLEKVALAAPGLALGLGALGWWALRAQRPPDRA